MIELVRNGTIGRILAAVALISYWLLPVMQSVGIWLSGWESWKLAIDFISDLPPGGFDSIRGMLVLQVLQDGLLTIGGIVALVYNTLRGQAVGGVLGLVAWIWSLNTAPVEVRGAVELLGGAYVSMAGFLALALLPLIARAMAAMSTSSSGTGAPLSISPTQSCPSCGNHNRVGSRFCGSCGVTLAQLSSVSRVRSREHFCTQCGSAVDSGDAFCGHCGTKIQANEGSSS